MEKEKLPIRRPESLPHERERRILVLGSRMSGAVDLGPEFQEYLSQRNVAGVDVNVLQDAGFIEREFLGQKTTQEGRLNPKLPLGVILFPEMRQYTPDSGVGMSLDTYSCGIAEFVRELCSKYHVPLHEIRMVPESDATQVISEIKAIMDLRRDENK